MSYLNNSAINIDAVLTKRGRELFSKGLFKVTKFALSDDEVDYRLYDKSHPSGSSYYASAITNMPVLEALPDGTTAMKSKLISLNKGTTKLPIITVGVSTINLRAASINFGGEVYPVSPTTVNGNNSVSGYTATIYDSTYVDLLTYNPIGIIKDPNPPNPIIPASAQQSAPHPPPIDVYPPPNLLDAPLFGESKTGFEFFLRGKAVPAGTIKTTTLVITGNDTGGSATITVTVQDYGDD